MLKALEIVAVCFMCGVGLIVGVCIGGIYLLKKLFDDERSEEEFYL